MVQTRRHHPSGLHHQPLFGGPIHLTLARCGLEFSFLALGDYRVGFIVPVFFNEIASATVTAGETTVVEVAIPEPAPILQSVPEGSYTFELAEGLLPGGL